MLIAVFSVISVQPGKTCWKSCSHCIIKWYVKSPAIAVYLLAGAFLLVDSVACTVVY